jgi:hypothetical protein
VTDAFGRSKTRPTSVRDFMRPTDYFLGMPMNENDRTRPITIWQRAPRDGSVINVELSDGAITQARWDLIQERWQFPRADGNLMTLVPEQHGLPRDWWPEF